MTSLRACLAVLLAAVGCVVLASPAVAETVRLKSGRALAVEGVRFLDTALEVTLRVEGGTARVVLPFERLDPVPLLGLWDRVHAAQDATARLASARLAEDLGLRAEAAQRFHETAALEPLLAAPCEAGLGRLRAGAASQALGILERDFRRHAPPAALLSRAEGLLDGQAAGDLSATQQRRATVLAALARGLLQRDARRAAAASVVPVPPPGVSAAAPPADERGARVAALEVKAHAAQEAAADPNLATTQALRHLETAARAFQTARRLVREAPAPAAWAETGERLRQALVHLYLELADLHRGALRFADAQAHLRAASLLDPGHEDVAEMRRLLAEDIRVATTPPVDPYGPVFETFLWRPWPCDLPTWGYAPFAGGSRRVRLRAPGWGGLRGPVAPRRGSMGGRVIGRRR